MEVNFGCTIDIVDCMCVCVCVCVCVDVLGESYVPCISNGNESKSVLSCSHTGHYTITSNVHSYHITELLTQRLTHSRFVEIQECADCLFMYMKVIRLSMSVR